MESDWILVGRAVDGSSLIGDFFGTHDPYSENHCWVDVGELGIELDSFRECIAVI